tara:strand:- start:63 stop:371 length:309 start_codon:yes stop_codon:yes gene_type:complete
MPTLNLKSHSRRKGKPVGYRAPERSDEEAVAVRSTSRWRRLSQQIRRERPLCQRCEEAGTLTPSTEVHHIAKLQSKPHLAFSPQNLRALCHNCHLIEEQTSK